MNDIIEVGAGAAGQAADGRYPPAGGLSAAGAGFGLWDPRSRRVVGGFLQMHIPGFFVPGRHPKQTNPMAVCKLQGCSLLWLRFRMSTPGALPGRPCADGAHFGGQDSRGLRIWPVRNLQGEKGLRRRGDEPQWRHARSRDR